MKLQKWIKIVIAASSVLALTACTSARKHNDAAVDRANAAYSTDAQGAEAQGAGEEASFGEQAGHADAQSMRIFYFDFDSNVVRETDRPAIYANADKLVANPAQRVIVEGYTDPRGSREYNIGLGERRAKAVAELLRERGANPSQIRLVSYGSSKRVSTGHSESDYQADRRVIINYVQK